MASPTDGFAGRGNTGAASGSVRSGFGAAFPPLTSSSGSTGRGSGGVDVGHSQGSWGKPSGGGGSADAAPGGPTGSGGGANGAGAAAAGGGSSAAPGGSVTMGGSTGDPMEQVVCSGHSRSVQHVAVSQVADGSFWICSSCLDGRAMIRNGDTGDWVGTLLGHEGAVWQSSWGPEATAVATASADFSVRVWDARTGDTLTETPLAHVGRAVQWWADGPALGTAALSGAGNGDSGDSKPPARGSGPGGASSSQLIAAGTKLNQLVLIDPGAGGKVVATVPTGHAGRIGLQSVTFAAADDLFTTAVDDTAVKRWDLRDPSRAVSTVDVPGLVAANVVFAQPSGMTFLHTTTTTGAQLRRLGDLGRPQFSVTVKVPQGDTVKEPVACSAAALSGGAGVVAVGQGLRVHEYDLKGNILGSHVGHHGPVFSVAYSPRKAHRLVSGAEDGMLRIWPSFKRS
eukprot:TRINITY_DN68099_c0_g1_i1.p1 TRINITY_DN68099_c0_g1~~TRINITY_DN68099_c0_g1_i1.p1  ORF type:complete len:455 (-),score=96.53 TRINITY_DN68099_c0_g1_i1:314-1678(-)